LTNEQRYAHPQPFADVNGARLAYDIVGDGWPLVLIHAGIADRRMWDDQVAVFAERYTVIRYDMRGFGDSEPPSGPYAHHRDLHGLLQHLGVESAYLVGASFGGGVAVEFTLAYPAMARALVLVDAFIPGHEPSESLQRFGEAEEQALERGDLAAAVELNIRTWVDGAYRTPDQVDLAARERVRTMQLRAFELMRPDALEEEPQPPFALERLAEIHIPTLVLVGDQDMSDFLALADIVATRVSGAHKIVIGGSAHVPSMEHPDRFNQLVLEFLASL
jgi:pimeloyl-ACP methyl ester carboxylesterase